MRKEGVAMALDTLPLLETREEVVMALDTLRLPINWREVIMASATPLFWNMERGVHGPTHPPSSVKQGERKGRSLP